jgi:DNA-directed RNA polymerase subunit RPC12/RpoP
MDVIFNCTHCDQELSVDAAGAGSEIECPACGGKLVIPGTPPEAGAPPRDLSHPVNPIATSAAAREEKHFAVPVHDAPTESLITKPLPTLEVAAKEGIKLRVKSIRRSDCFEVGKDHFDEVVTHFLEKVGEANLIKIDTFNYTHQDLATREWVTDYGAFIVYKG